LDLLPVKSRLIAAAACVTLVGVVAFSAQRSSGPAKGILILDGGGTTAIVRDRFVSLAGGAKARIVVIPTGVSAYDLAKRTRFWIRTGREIGRNGGVRSLSKAMARD
jgi:hypothetical protein